MARDPETIAHQEWLGFVQPVGLVVSIPALLQAQAHVNKNIAPDHQRFLACLPEDADDPQIKDFPGFTRDVLGWESEDLVGTDGRPLPDTLEVALPEYNETLRPTYAVPEFDRDRQNKRWMMLVNELPKSTDLDKVTVEDERRWQASPHSRFERLLRETQIPIGLLFNGTELRLVYAPRGETSGHATFRVPEMTQVAGRPIFAALHMLLCGERLFSLPEKRRLAAILADSRKYQNLVSTQLAEQVLAALYELLRGFQAADDQRKGELLREILEADPNHVYAGLLTVLMRLVFILYAEDRGLLSSDSVYVNHYSVTGLFERLRADAGRFPDTMDQRYGAWAQLLVLFRIIHDGARHGDFQIPGRRGYLFDPDRYSFLEGRPGGSWRDDCEKLDVPRVPDGVIFRVLQNLLILDGERLSYRTLDVEQIGSVYEAIMGFRLEIAGGRSIAIKPVKSHGAPATINLEALLALKPGDRAKWLREATDQKFDGKAGEALKDVKTIEELLAALDRKIAHHVTPNVVPKSAMVLQPSDERRRSGSHYTPRILTEPIVRKALQPILERLGDKPTPEQLLDLRICDSAMGSGAFLVETCRQLGDELVKAWHMHNCVPKIPPDEDEVLHARRVIAQRCLYGVDKNPMAVDLAKLSLWLATLAKDHPFTFLDHALRCGDSLVGLSRQQIVHFHWEEREEPVFPLQQVHERMQRATQYRKEILDAGDTLRPEDKAQKLAVADEALDFVRFAGDLCVAAFFAGEKDKQRKKLRDEYLDALTGYLQTGDLCKRPTKEVDALRKPTPDSPHPISPFHWEIEFPEVFSRENGGFDAFVGNPPFAGKNYLIKGNREYYLDWLQTLHEESHGTADLVAHFFRRAFGLLREGGCFGLIATNSVGQGDTRSTGLRWICTHGGTLFAARKRYKWPGQAAVIVSLVHVSRGELQPPFDLDGRAAPMITAYLFHSGGHESPAALLANGGRSFIGSYLLGMGFTFDDAGSDGAASPIAEMDRLIRKDPHNAERILPYIGGEEINEHPRHEPCRYVISFEDWPLQRDDLGNSWDAADNNQRREWLRSGIVPLDYPEKVARDYPDLLSIVEQRVKPERMKQKDAGGRHKWWQFLRSRPELHRAIEGLPRVLLCSRIGNAFAFTFVPAGIEMNEKTVVFPFATAAPFAVIQSRIHEAWARFFSSTLKDDLQYTPSECFETFPFPEGFDPDPRLEAAGDAYYEFRAALMIRNNEGLTKTYNRFHDPNETSPGILKLRELHAAMDRAVLDAYGWTDIPTSCLFLLDYEEDEDEDADSGAAPRARSRKKPWRYRWPDDIRDEVLARLLDLNARRAEEERLTGVAANRKTGISTRSRKKTAEATPDLFEAAKARSKEIFTPVPMLEAVELMVAIVDTLKPARVQQLAAERMFILAVNRHARELYSHGNSAAATIVTQPGATFSALWRTLLAMNYATLSASGIVTRTRQGIALTKPEHTQMVEAAVALFREGQAKKHTWPVEVDNVQYVVP